MFLSNPVEAIPRLQVFWNVDESTILSTPTSKRTGGGGEYLADVTSLPAIPISNQKPQQSPQKPEAGIYIRGIWVKTPKISNTIMSFTSNRIDVNGRDRNDVDEEELIHATAYILMNCMNKQLLKQLVEPLRGKSSKYNNTTSTNSSSSINSTAYSKLI